MKRRIILLGCFTACFAGNVQAAMSNKPSKASLMQVSLPKVVVRLASMQTKNNNLELYRVMRKAEDRAGMMETIAYLYGVLGRQITHFSEEFSMEMLDEVAWGSIAIEGVFLQAFCELLQHKRKKDREMYEMLAEEIETMKDALFHYLQPLMNDLSSSSPRGSQDEISYHKKKKSFGIEDSWNEVIRHDLDRVLIDCLCG